MKPPRIIIESQFSIEQRTLSRRVVELPAQSGYLLAHLRNAQNVCLPANPHQVIRPGAYGQPGELLIVRLEPQLLIETAARLRMHCTGANLLFRHPLAPITDDRKLSAALEAIYTELSEAAPGWREVLSSLVSQLAVYLLRAHINVRRSEEVELSRVGIVDRRLRRAIEFLHDNCARDLTLAEIAAAAYLSEFHFARLFKKITGTTPHAYLASLRIERARRLLAETDLAIAEIGARVGYNSQSHFTRIFRATTGLTPQAFRAAAISSLITD